MKKFFITVKYVISLGGSIINPGEINTKLLKKLKKLVAKTKHELVIVCGGGAIARDYIKAGYKLNALSVRLDEIGIRATELNAELVAAVLGVRRSRTIEEVMDKKLAVTNGLFPGVTSDFDCVVIAGLIGADAVINLSNVEGVYDKDPRKHEDARLLKKLTYSKLVELASKHELGLGTNFVFDLAASKLASRTRTKLVFIKGLTNLKKVLNKKQFKGSVVK